MVTKNDIKSKFLKGMKPAQADFELLIDNSFNDSITINKVSSTSDIAFSNFAVDRIVDADTVEITSTGAYAQIGLVVPSAQGKRFLVQYEIQNIGTVNVTRWGYRNGYNNTGSGIGEFEQEYVLPYALNANNSRSGQFILNQKNNRPRAMGLIFIGGNGGKFRLKQKVYDVTSMDEKTLYALDSFVMNQSDNSFNNISDLSKTTLKIQHRGSNWKNKILVTVGDSITANGGYQSILKEQLGFKEIINRGIAGSSTENMLNNVTQADMDAADLITVYGFFNNFTAGSPALGELTDVASNEAGSTFVSRFKHMLNTLIAMAPNKQYVIIATHNGAGATLPAIYQPINGGKNIGDYTEMMGKVTRMYYGYKFIDLYGLSGINSFNINYFTNDGLHFNNFGNQRIGNILVGEIDQVQPLS